jgi:hypothetical protein
MIAHSTLAGMLRKEDFQLALRLSSTMTYHSNLGLNSDEESDTVFSMQPRVELSKPRGFLRGSIETGVAVVRYLDSSENDSENVILAADIEAGEVFGEGSPVTVRTEIEQTNDADGFTGEVTRQELYGIVVDGRHRFGFGGGAFASFSHRFSKSRSAGFSDVETRSWRMGGFYQKAADSFALEFDYEHQLGESKGEGGLESETEILSAGIRGPLLSTLSGSVRLGVQERNSESETLDQERVPFYQINLNWMYSSLMSVDLRASRQFFTDSSNRSRDQTIIGLSLKRNFGGPWTGEVGLKYSENQFQEEELPNQTATTTGFFAELDHRIADWGELRFLFELDEARASEETFNYQAYRVGLELSARF